MPGTVETDECNGTETILARIQLGRDSAEPAATVCAHHMRRLFWVARIDQSVYNPNNPSNNARLLYGMMHGVDVLRVSCCEVPGQLTSTSSQPE